MGTIGLESGLEGGIGAGLFESWAPGFKSLAGTLWASLCFLIDFPCNRDITKHCGMNYLAHVSECFPLLGIQPCPRGGGSVLGAVITTEQSTNSVSCLRLASIAAINSHTIFRKTLLSYRVSCAPSWLQTHM